MSRDRRRRPPYWYRGAIGFAAAVWLCVIGAIGACIGLAIAAAIAPPAHSAPPSLDQQAFEYWAHHGSSVCAALDRQPTVDGLVVAALDIFTHTSLNTAQAGQVIHLAIHYTCPQHQNLIDQYNAAQQRRNRGVMA